MLPTTTIHKAFRGTEILLRSTKHFHLLHYKLQTQVEKLLVLDKHPKQVASVLINKFLYTFFIF